MRTVSYRDDLLFGVANELDLDIGTPDFNNSHARKFANSATKWARIGWRAWDFPELTLTEERALRPIFDETSSYSEGDEVYKLVDAAGSSGTYLRAVEAVAAGAFDAEQWETNATPDPFLAYDQAGKQYMGEVTSVHPTDPRLSADPGPGFQFYPEQRGLRVPTSANPTVWVTYRTRPSLFTADEYDATRAYKQASLVYDAGTTANPGSGECYLAALDLAAGVPIGNVAWIYQPVPFVLSEFIRMNAAADAASDAVQKADFRAQATLALTNEIGHLKKQGQAARHYRLFPRRDSRTFNGASVLSTPPAVLR